MKKKLMHVLLTASITIIVNTLFTKEELKTSPKSDGCGRPALDQVEVNKMFDVILETLPGTVKKDVTEKIKIYRKCCADIE